MVKGLELFRDHFRDFRDRYILIGGTACDLAYAAAGLEFRATRDLDIVLCIETLDAPFARAFWAFIRAGGYQSQAASSGRPTRYRFNKPQHAAYPEMIELCSRAPDAIEIPEGSHLTPLPIDDDVSSLSAILLDDQSYRWIQSGRHELQGVPIARPEHLIPLKAAAWLDLRARSAAGQQIDSRSIKKHLNDVFRLFAIIDPAFRASLPPALQHHMKAFLAAAPSEPIDLRNLGLPRLTLPGTIEQLRTMYLPQAGDVVAASRT